MKRLVLIVRTLVLVSVFTLSAVFLFHNFMQENPIQLEGNDILGNSIERQKNNIEKSLNIELKNNALGSKYLENNTLYSPGKASEIALNGNVFLQAKLNNNQIEYEQLYSFLNSVKTFALFDNLNLFYISKIEPFGDQQLIFTNLKTKEDPIIIDLEPTSVQVYTGIFFDNKDKNLWLMSLTREGKYKIEYINTKFQIIDFTEINSSDSLKFIGKSNDQINFTEGNICKSLNQESKVFSEIKCVNKLSDDLEVVIYSYSNRLDLFDLSTSRKTTIELVSPKVISTKIIDENLFIHLQNELVIFNINADTFERISLRGNFLQETFVPIKVGDQYLIFNLKNNQIFNIEEGRLVEIETDEKIIPNANIYTSIEDHSVLVLTDE